MKKVFLDTNVVLDSTSPLRGETYQSANAILSACDFGEIQGNVSILTVANAAYILRKGRTEKEIVETLKELFEGLTILPMNNEQLQQAYNVEGPDFEDILQFECAKAANCDVLVTNNLKDYRFCNDIEVISTLDYVRQFIQTDSHNSIIS